MSEEDPLLLGYSAAWENELMNRTFLHMEQRKLNRQKYGRYQDQSPPWRKGVVLLFILGLVLYISDQVYFYVMDDRTLLVRQIFVVLLLFLVLLTLALKPQRIVYALTLTCLFYLVLFALTYPEATATYIAPIMLVLLVACFVSHFIYFYLFPWIISQSGFCFALHRIQLKSQNKRRSREILSNGRIDEVRFQYHKKLSYLRSMCCLRKERNNSTFSYAGQWEQGRPHGWGVWRDDSSEGERLSGYWYKGIPLGPFRSVEMVTANSFSCISMLLCSARKSGLPCMASREVTTDILYEAVNIECSISGSYYKNFPALYRIPGSVILVEFPPLHNRDEVPPISLNDDSLGAIIPQLRHVDENKPLMSVLVTATPEGIYVNGHKPLNETSSVSIELEDLDEEARQGHGLYQTLNQRSLDNLSSLRVVNWDMRENREALIFIHGYNISVDHAAKKLAQLIASGNFPSYVLPVVYSWPTGRTLFYFNSLQTIEHPAVIASLGRLLAHLHKAGISRVHFLTHSMGIRILLIALQYKNFRNLLYVRKHQPNLQLRREGEEIEESLQEQQEIEIEEKETIEKEIQPKVKILSATFLNPDYPLVPFRDEAYHDLHEVCSHITLYVDKTDSALGYQSCLSREPCIGLLNEPFRCGSNTNDDLLDLDMICVSDLQHNIHSLRHAAFNVNRSLLEDIREVIVSRKRAWNRDDRLIHKEGNFYSFLSTPSSITSDHIA